RFEVESFGARWIITQRGRRAVLDKVSELLNKSPGLRGPGRRFTTKREKFLKLIEGQERRDEIVARAPEMIAFAVKIFPQRLVRPGQRRFYTRRPGRGSDGVHDLMGQRTRPF